MWITPARITLSLTFTVHFVSPRFFITWIYHLINFTTFCFTRFLFCCVCFVASSRIHYIENRMLFVEITTTIFSVYFSTNEHLIYTKNALRRIHSNYHLLFSVLIFSVFVVSSLFMTVCSFNFWQTNGKHLINTSLWHENNVMLILQRCHIDYFMHSEEAKHLWFDFRNSRCLSH